MANYYTQIVVQPEIPADLLDEKTRERLKTCGLTCEHIERDDTYYLFSEAHAGSADDGAEYEDILQELLIKSNGRLPYLAVEAALTCSRPRPDGFGGYALLITAGDIKMVSTSNWLAAAMREVSAS